MHKRLKLEKLESRDLLAANLIITEFMASNDGSLEDGNGAASDWIEIHNAGDVTADLIGYSLTDDADDLNKWVFPTSTLLAPGEYLVVFASGNNAPDSAGKLHTNFSLSAGGEYLALVDSMGTVLSEYGPAGSDYPQQLSNISYGLAFHFDTHLAVTPESAVRYQVPTNSSDDATWMQPEFDHSLWQTGVASLGYETSGNDFASRGLLDTLLPAGTTTAYVRIPFSVTDTSTLLSKLQMKYDDGFIAYLNGTVIASANAPASPGFNSVATADYSDALAVQYVDFNVSSYSHLLNQGSNILAIHMLNKVASSSDMLASIQLMTTTEGLANPAQIGALQSPTPGGPNTNLRASDVVFSRIGGIFVDSFQLTLSTPDSSEQIRFTRNGSEPTATSELYTGPITLSANTQIRARAFGPLGQQGITRVESFTRSAAATAEFTSNLPIIVIENFGAGRPGTVDFEDAALSLYDVDESTGRASLSNPADLSTTIGQHRRGRSTANNPKNNLRIEIRDSSGEDLSVSLLGMPSESDWVLYAPYSWDRSMIRDAAFYELSRQMGNWAPRTRFVEVYTNYYGNELNEYDYVGVYVLMENIKRDSNRVDIAELTPTQNTEPNITGGYIFSLDGIDGETPAGSAWKTERNIPTLGDSWLVHEDPDYPVMTEEQVAYLRNYIQDFEDALYGPNSTDPVLGYQAYFDVDASIDHHLIRIFSREPDSLRFSTYLTKDRDGKIAFGPVWDFDRSSGSEDARSANPQGWTLSGANFFESDWWGPLFDDPNFAQKWADRWQELRQGVLSNASLEATITGLASQLTEAQVRNFAKWTDVLPNGGPYAAPGLIGWEAEVSQLKNWLLARANWMDSQFTQVPNLSPASGGATSGQQILLSSAPSTTIYYTLDGTDPRASGGGLSPSAIPYTGPITISATTQVVARAYGTVAGGVPIPPWSAMVAGLYSVEAPADASNFRISELHFHPSDPTPTELAAKPLLVADDYEFIEFINFGNQAISLNGVHFTNAIEFDFTSSAVTSIQPGETVLIVKNIEAFTLRYGTGFNIAGTYDGNLSNSGENLELVDGAGDFIHDFTFDDASPWPTAADGNGPSMEVVNLLGDYTQGTNWRASSTNGGTPGIHFTLTGDYDFSGTVDTADYTVWKLSFGSVTLLAADGNQNGVVDLADYTVWRDNLGATLAPPAFVAPMLATYNSNDETPKAPTASNAPAIASLPPLLAPSEDSPSSPPRAASTHSIPPSDNSASQLLLLDRAFSELDEGTDYFNDCVAIEPTADDAIDNFEELTSELLAAF